MWCTPYITRGWGWRIILNFRSCGANSRNQWATCSLGLRPTSIAVCLVVGSMGWSGSNPRFGDGSNPWFVWLWEWVWSVFCLVRGLRWGWIHPIFCLVGWIQTEHAYGHLCTKIVRLPSSIYAIHSNICAQHIAIFHMLAPCIKDQHTK
jgi:hypothetical protein